MEIDLISSSVFHFLSSFFFLEILSFHLQHSPQAEELFLGFLVGAVLMATISFNFCFSENIFICFNIVEDFLGWQFPFLLFKSTALWSPSQFPCELHTVSNHSSLRSIPFFSLSAFRFLFIFGFQQFDYDVFRHSYFLIYSAWGLLSFLHLSICVSQYVGLPQIFRSSCFCAHLCTEILFLVHLFWEEACCTLSLGGGLRPVATAWIPVFSSDVWGRGGACCRTGRARSWCSGFNRWLIVPGFTSHMGAGLSIKLKGLYILPMDR